MHNYSGNSSVIPTNPPVISEISDGDDLNEAHLNPPIEQLTDIAAYTVTNGVFLPRTQAFTGVNSFNALTVFGSNTRLPAPFTLANSGDQTINPSSQGTNYYRGITRGSTSIVRLDSTASDGDWVELVFTMAVGVDVWQFRRGSDNTANICTLDNSIVNVTAGTSILGGNTVIDGAFVKFMHVGGVWRLGSIGMAIKAGTYA